MTSRQEEQTEIEAKVLVKIADSIMDHPKFTTKTDKYLRAIYYLLRAELRLRGF